MYFNNMREPNITSLRSWERGLIRSTLVYVLATLGVLVVGLFVWWGFLPASENHAVGAVVRDIDGSSSYPLTDSASRNNSANSAIVSAIPEGTLRYDCSALYDQLEEPIPSEERMRIAYATPRCKAALEERFLDAPTSNTILTLSRPLTWRRVFENTSTKIARVIDTLDNESCDVAVGDILEELGSDCAASASVDVAVLALVCTTMHSEPLLDSSTGLPVGVPRENPYGHHLSRLLPGSLQTSLERLAADSGDQESYWRDRERIEELYFRTAWTKYECDSRATVARAIFEDPRLTPGLLLERAARLGDEFALAHYDPTPKDIDALMRVNPVQAYVHLARQAARRFHNPVPIDLKPRYEQKVMKFVLTADLLARASSIDLSRDNLYKIANPDYPSYMSVADVERARLDAEALVSGGQSGVVAE